jgi:ABC-type glycerol-3-phosphate transport system substrate-binding protein
MKKLLLLTVTLLVASVMLFAAGGGEETAAAEGPVTIDYSFWGNPVAIGVERDIIDAYHAMQDDVRVAPVVAGYGDYHTMLLTQMAGGSGPDVMRVDSYYFEDFLSLGALQQIDDLVERDDIDLSVYYQQGIEENTYEGNLYGLPWATSPLVMFINLDVFEEAGVAVPDFDWTVDDFEEIARRLSDGDTYGYGLGLTTVSAILPHVWAEGGDLFSEDRERFTLHEPAAVRGLDRLARMYAEGLIPEDAITAQGDTITRWFVNNQIGMRMGAVSDILSTQAVEGVRFEVINMPTGGPQNPRTTVYKSNIVGIGTASDDVEAAWDFLKFLRGPEGQGEELYMRAKRMSPSIADQRYWDLYADPTLYPQNVEGNFKIIAAEYGRLLPLTGGWLEVENLVVPELQGIVSGAISAQEAMRGIAADAQAVLDRAR